MSNCTLSLLGNATFKNAQIGISNNATLDVTTLNVPLAASNRVALAGNLVAAINKSGFTSLLVASNLTYGGTLTLSNLGPALAYGDTIKLFNASNYSGAFNSIVPASPGTGLLWNTNWLAVNGSLFVTSTNATLITPPLITSFQMLNGNLAATGTNGNAPGTYILHAGLDQPCAAAHELDNPGDEPIRRRRWIQFYEHLRFRQTTAVFYFASPITNTHEKPFCTPGLRTLITVAVRADTAAPVPRP